MAETPSPITDGAEAGYGESERRGVAAHEVAEHEHHEVAATGDDPPEARLSRRRLLWRRFRRNRMAMVGLVLLTLWVLLAVFGPIVFNDYHYRELTSDIRQSPSRNHWAGTTQNGRDLFAMAMEGMRKSFLVGLAVGLGSTTISAVVGSFAGYFSGWLDKVVLWVIDLLLVLPAFLIIAIVVNNTGSAGGGIALLIVLLAGLGWMLSARVVRSLTQSVRDREYITAAKYMGVSGPRIVFRHIIPNISSLLIIDATLAIGAAVLAETGLSFFGFGIRPPNVSLGSLIGDGSRQASTFPWIFYAGAVPLVWLILAINFIGDGLRDALDPKDR